MSNYVIPENHWETVLEELPKKLLKKSVMYMVRIYIEKHDKYMFKLGYSENFKKRIVSLNTQYGACGRIIPVLIVRCKTQIKERIAHRKLSNLAMSTKLRFTKCNELYPISPEVYDQIKITMESLTTREVWESNSYCIDDKRDAEDHENSNLILDYFEMFCETYLCQDKEEAQFWNDRIYID